MKTTTLHGVYAAPTYSETNLQKHQRRLYRTFAPDINVVSKNSIKSKINSFVTQFFYLLPADCRPKKKSDKWYIATIFGFSISLIIPYFLPLAIFFLYKAKKGVAI